MLGKIETRVGIFVLAAFAIFFYMGLKIGSFRFDYDKYNTYTLYFKDFTGIGRKAEVRVAGVKVGWVHEVTLIVENNEVNVRADVMVLGKYSLYKDSYALVRQDGFIGPRYIEIVPGDPMQPLLVSGDTVSRPSVEPASIDEILAQFGVIARNITEVTSAFNEAIGGPSGTQQLRRIVDSVGSASDRVASVAKAVEHFITNNEENLQSLFGIGSDFKKLATRLDDHVFPAFEEGIDKISRVFDRDFGRVADRVLATSEMLEEASVQARDGLRSITSVVEKIDDGQGLIGKLVNDEETYRDLSVAVKGFRNYVAKLDSLQVVLDAHSEAMYRRAENYQYANSKGYFNVRLYPSEDYFYMIELASSEKGFITRKQTEREYLDEKGEGVNITKIENQPEFRYWPQNILIERRLTVQRNMYRWGLQFGKSFGDVTFRFGLFDGTAGAALDIDVPLYTNRARWITTFEIFDLRGWNRRDDRRAHLKWTNRMFVFDNIYAVFGADDFVSKRNASAFFGVGMRFGDDDIKYFISSFSGVASGVGH